MFQYAFARRMSIETGCIVKLDSLGGFRNDFFSRGFKLNRFNITLNEAEPDDLRIYIYYHDSIPGRLFSKAGKIFHISENYIKTENENFAYDGSIFQSLKEHYYDGYWQNLDYFECIRDVLLKEFSLPENIEKKIQNIAGELKETESVAVHVRNPHALAGSKINMDVMRKFIILDADYYRMAFSYIKSKINNPKYYLFCEDEEYALSVLPGGEIERIIKNEDYADLIIMSKCRHQIIANSTFSWWAAWLNSYERKITVSPELWFNDPGYNPENLLKSFIRI